MPKRRFGFIGFVFLTGIILLIAAGFIPGPAVGVAADDDQDPATPAPMGSITDRLAPPVLPDHPSQADLGNQVYYYVCMACHGDLGQGLTPEWVEEWGLEGNTCWQSKCHASNHPPEGFELPKAIPAVVSPGMIARFETALDLYTFLKGKMPWQAPGSLTDVEYWQLTAFLLRSNGIDLGPTPLDAQRAAGLRLRSAPPPPSPQGIQGESGFWFWVSSAIVLGIGLLVLLVKFGRDFWARKFTRS